MDLRGFEGCFFGKEREGAAAAVLCSREEERREWEGEVGRRVLCPRSGTATSTRGILHVVPPGPRAVAYRAVPRGSGRYRATSAGATSSWTWWARSGTARDPGGTPWSLPPEG
jgi:hypothetical protein